MANIDNELQAIKNAVYGEEVRTSIHDGIKAVNDSATASALVCETKATEAAQSASNAQTAATTASTKAEAAEASSVSAKTDADRAEAAARSVSVATTSKAGIVKPDGTTITVDADGTIHGASAGSSVTWNQLVSTGTHIADISVDGSTTAVYAPTSGGSGGSALIRKSQAEFDAMTESERDNGESYLIYDAITPTPTGIIHGIRYYSDPDNYNNLSINDKQKITELVVTNETRDPITADDIPYDETNSILTVISSLNDTMIKSKTYTFSGFTTSANSWKELLTIDYSSIGASEVLGVVPLYFSASANTLFTLSLNVSKNRIYLITASSVTVNDLALTILYR